MTSEPHATERTVPELSVVIPVYNEEESLPELARRLTATLSQAGYSYEVIFVNDGSRDRSPELLRGLAAADSRLKVISLSRNFGHQAAMYAGLRRASGRAVVLMDGDLQDPPEVLPRLVERWREGFQVVHAIRTKRKERLLLRTAYRLYYRLLRSMSYIEITLDSGDFSLMDRQVVDLLAAMPERNKFLRGLRSWVGFRQTELVYERDPRFAGTPKYTLMKLIKLGLDGMFSYSYVPLRLCYLVGFLIALGSFLLALVYFSQRLFSRHFIPQGFTTLAILVLFLGGVQLVAVGLIGEYIGRIYDEVKHRPQYVESELLNLPGSHPEAP